MSVYIFAPFHPLIHTESEASAIRGVHSAFSNFLRMGGEFVPLRGITQLFSLPVICGLREGLSIWSTSVLPGLNALRARAALRALH